MENTIPASRPRYSGVAAFSMPSQPGRRFVEPPEAALVLPLDSRPVRAGTDSEAVQIKALREFSIDLIKRSPLDTMTVLWVERVPYYSDRPPYKPTLLIVGKLPEVEKGTGEDLLQTACAGIVKQIYDHMTSTGMDGIVELIDERENNYVGNCFLPKDDPITQVWDELCKEIWEILKPVESKWTIVSADRRNRPGDDTFHTVIFVGVDNAEDPAYTRVEEELVRLCDARDLPHVTPVVISIRDPFALG